MRQAEDGLAMLDKSLAMLATASQGSAERRGHRAGSSVCGGAHLSGGATVMHRHEQGMRLLAQVQGHPTGYRCADDFCASACGKPPNNMGWAYERGLMSPQNGPVLRLAGVHKHYQLGAHRIDALRGVDLDVQAGELLALTGPSGSGKSTLLNLCGLIDTPDAGDIELNGQPVNALDETARTLLRRDALGFVFPELQSDSGDDRGRERRLPAVSGRMCPAERRQRGWRRNWRPWAWPEHAHHRLDALSGGQRQRVAIARALIKAPQPGDCRRTHRQPPFAHRRASAGADARTRPRRRRRLCHRHHDNRLTARCDRVVNLLDGRIHAPC